MKENKTRTKIKICGISTIEQVRLVNQYPIDLIGFVTYEKSPRYASVDCIRQMIDYISGKISTVVLLVNPTRDYVHKIIKTLQPSFLQFHGDETPKFCNQFDYPYIKAIRVSPDLNIERAIEHFNPKGGFLFDTWHPKKYGGTGGTFDWDVLPNELKAPKILAGGLTSTNVGQAIKIARPDVVDVSGGVESLKGIKDERLIANFVDSVGSADMKINKK